MITYMTRGLETAWRSLPAVALAMVLSATWDVGVALLMARHPLPQEFVRGWQQETQALTQRYSERGAPGPGSMPAPVTPSMAKDAKRLLGVLAPLKPWAVHAKGLLIPLALLALAAWAWMTAGRLGYLEARMQQPTSLRTFWTVGAERLVPVLKVAGLRAVFGAAVFAVSAGLVLLERVGPPAWQAGWSVLSDAGVFGIFALMIWFSVVSIFWFIAAVVDRLGPVAALKASVAAARRQFWSVCGLLAGWILVSLALMVLLAYPRELMSLGDPRGGQLFDASVGVFVAVFTRFAFDASLIACYRQGQAPASETGQPGDAGA